MAKEELKIGEISKPRFEFRSFGRCFDDAAKLRAQIAELDTLQNAVEDARLACHCMPDECKNALDAAITAVHRARGAAITALCDMLREAKNDA